MAEVGVEKISGRGGQVGGGLPSSKGQWRRLGGAERARWGGEAREMSQLLLLTKAEALLKGEVSVRGRGVSYQHSSSDENRADSGKWPGHFSKIGTVD